MIRLVAIVLLSGCCGHAALEQRVAALERAEAQIEPFDPAMVYDDLIPRWPNYYVQNNDLLLRDYCPERRDVVCPQPLCGDDSELDAVLDLAIEDALEHMPRRPCGGSSNLFITTEDCSPFVTKADCLWLSEGTD